MNKSIKYLYILFFSLWCISLKAEVVLSLRQANKLKKDGEIAFNTKDYQSAITCFEQAAIAYKHFGKLINYLSCCDYLSTSYEYIGLYNKAISVTEQMMEIHLMAISDKDSNYSMQLGQLAHLYSLKGDYNKAIDLATKALELKQIVFGDESKEYVTALNNIAYYYYCLGNYDVATSFMSRAASIIENTEGKNSIEYAKFLNYMASVCYRLGMYEWGLNFETTCVDILSCFQDSDDYYIALQNLALYKISVNSDALDDAIELTKKSLSLQVERKKTTTSFYGIGMCNLMCFYIEAMKFDEAEKCGKEILDLYTNIYGDSHPDITAIYERLSGLYMKANKKNNAIESIINTTEGYYKQTLNTFKKLTRDERRLYWLRYEPWCLYQLPLYAFELNNEEVNGCTYDATLFSKGLLLNSEMEISEIIKESGDSILFKEYLEIHQLNNKINYLSQLVDIHKTVDLDSLKKMANQKEKFLIEKSLAYRDFTNSLNIRWRTVRDKLKYDDIAIEFLSFPYDNENKYIALLLKKEWEFPKMIPLSFNDSIHSDDYTYLSSNIWHPLIHEFKNVSNIYFSPVGQLHRYPIESFPFPGENLLMSEKFNIYRLSSTRELAMDRHQLNGQNAVVYGDLQYDMDLSALEEDAKLYQYEIERNIFLNNEFETSNIREIRASLKSLPDLPGTKIEIEQIVSFLKKANPSPNAVLDYTRNRGTEISFKQLSGKKKRIIHIATHGYYLSDDDKVIDMLYSMKPAFGLENDDVRSVEDKSLTRSGLFFAGADNKLQDEEIPVGLDDGILTAQEISTLDLRGLDMVTLSACQTAQGDITGDGVFGLQRGFKKAGANSILMSLWKVDDAATCVLMTEFYRNWMNGKTKHDALELAKEMVRSQKEKGWDNPKYWAAFILLDGLD